MFPKEGCRSVFVAGPKYLDPVGFVGVLNRDQPSVPTNFQPSSHTSGHR